MCFQSVYFVCILHIIVFFSFRRKIELLWRDVVCIRLIFWWEKLKMYWRNFGNYRQTCEKPITSFPNFRKNDEMWLWLTTFEKIVRNSHFQCTVKRQYVGEKDIVPKQNFHSTYKNLHFLTNLGKKYARRSFRCTCSAMFKWLETVILKCCEWTKYFCIKKKKFVLNLGIRFLLPLKWLFKQLVFWCNTFLWACCKRQ